MYFLQFCRVFLQVAEEKFQEKVRHSLPFLLSLRGNRRVLTISQPKQYARFTSVSIMNVLSKIRICLKNNVCLLNTGREKGCNCSPNKNAYVSFSKKPFSFLTLLGQRGWISPHFFQMAISPWKKVLEVLNFVTFPNSLWTSRKSKIFLVFHSVLGWSRRCILGVNNFLVVLVFESALYDLNIK